MSRKNALKNLKALNQAHKEFIKLSTDDIALSLEKTAFTLFQSLQIGTPKDTSRAVNGWIVKIDTPQPSGWKPPKGLSIYFENSFPFGKINFDSMVWISNNVEYIIVLNKGHSQQAPYGFTNEALRRTLFYTNTEINKLNKKKYNV